MYEHVRLAVTLAVFRFTADAIQSPHRIRQSSTRRSRQQYMLGSWDISQPALGTLRNLRQFKGLSATPGSASVHSKPADASVVHVCALHLQPCFWPWPPFPPLPPWDPLPPDPPDFRSPWPPSPLPPPLPRPPPPLRALAFDAPPRLDFFFLSVVNTGLSHAASAVPPYDSLPPVGGSDTSCTLPGRAPSTREDRSAGGGGGGCCPSPGQLSCAADASRWSVCTQGVPSGK